jgi:hypothetical protein
MTNKHKNFLLPELIFRQNRQLLFDYEIPYDLVAALGGGERKNLTIPFWCCILKIARTHFGCPPMADADFIPDEIQS